MPDPAPFVLFIPGFGDSSLNFTLTYQVREFVDQDLAQHELRNRIFNRFRKEKIEIPFPCRNLYLQDLSRKSDRGKEESPAMVDRLSLRILESVYGYKERDSWANGNPNLSF
jgi:small-conductance mechanosensitive channel